MRVATITAAASIGMFLPVAARAADAESSIWTVEGCAGVLAQVIDSGSGNPIAGAKVAIEPRTVFKGAPADSAAPGPVSSDDLRPIGRTSAEGTIILPPPGARRLVITAPGWETKYVETPCTDAITVLDVMLSALPPERSELASAGGDAHRIVRGDSLEHMAGAPRNVFQAVETLPGVARPTFQNMILGSILGSGDLGVRGARSGESRTFLDGIELPYFYHYLGFSSVVPAEMVEMVDFVPSGAGPQFGRLTGGVLDIHSRALRGDDDDQPWHGRGNLQLWEGNAIARGPVAGGTLSLSDRTSIWDHLLKRDWGEGIPVWSYNDFQAVYKKPLSHGSEMSALAVGAFDDVLLAGNETPTHLRTEFYRVGSSFRARGDAGSKLQLAASWGYDRFHVTVTDPEAGLQVSSLRSQKDLRGAVDGEFRLGGRLPVRAGVEVHGVEPTAGLKGDVQMQEWIIFDRTYKDRGWWSAAWTEVEVRPDERVVLIPGFRADYDSFVGEAWFDPRLTMRWFVVDGTALSVSGGLYKKPHPFSLAFADNRKLGLTEGTQVSGGVEQKIGEKMSVDARIFESTFQNQVQGWEWIPDFDEYGNSITGDGRSYGAEIWGKFEAGKNLGAFGYTYSRTEWKNLSTHHQWTAADQDATHAVSLVVNRRMRKNWNGGVRLRWYTGLPYTYYDAAVFVPDASSYVGVGENPYAQRAPSYFQMDVRMTKRWQPSSRMAIETFLDVQNVTNRKNVDGYSGGNPSDPNPSMALGLFPSIGVSVVF